VAKVISRKASLGFAEGAVALKAKSGFDPSTPLANVKHERFCWAIVQGHRLGPAYEIAGFAGKSPRLPWQLRHKPAIDARVNWLLAQRVETDTRARHRTEKKIADSRLRLIRELERIAFYDPRDFVRWERRAKFDEDQQLIGFEDVMIVTPSGKLTADQAAAVRSVTTKSGSLKFETYDKLGALEKLAKVLGIYQESALSPIGQSVTVNQVNFSGDNSLEVARRLAFALAKLSHTGSPGQLIEADGVGGDPKK
jgi:hypothetical protein